MKNLFIQIAIVILIFFWMVPVAHASTPPPPQSTPETPEPPSKPSIIQQITQVLHFPVPSITAALKKVFTEAAQEETRNLSREIRAWSQIFGEISQVPPAKFYRDLAQSSLPAAGALAGALFLLRLAIHHWSRLAGENEPLTTVLSDWLVAGMLAVLSGPFLDLLVRLTWWLSGAVLGESSILAQQFMDTITLGGLIRDAGLLSKPSIFTTLLVLGLSIGGFLAAAGMLFAFGSANAVLFILAFLGPPVAVVAVIPQMRWLRSLWLKAVALVAILPFVGGGIFKASITLSFLSFGGGLLSLFLRVLWLWGAAGFMISLAGILSRMTIATSVDALGQTVGAVKGIIDKAAMVGMGLATGGSGIASAGVMGGSGDLGGPGLGGTSMMPGGMDGLPKAASHFQQSQDWTSTARGLNALGLRGAAQYAQSLSQENQIAGQQAEISDRIQRLANNSDVFDEFDSIQTETGNTSTQNSQSLVPGMRLPANVSQRVLANFAGKREEFGPAYQGFSQAVQEKEGTRFQLDTILAAHPEETARMVSAYYTDPEPITTADQPLRQAAISSGANQVLFEAYGERLNIDSQT